jgi:hypothetical protein
VRSIGLHRRKICRAHRGWIFPEKRAVEIGQHRLSIWVTAVEVGHRPTRDPLERRGALLLKRTQNAVGGERSFEYEVEHSTCAVEIEARGVDLGNACATQRLSHKFWIAEVLRAVRRECHVRRKRCDKTEIHERGAPLMHDRIFRLDVFVPETSGVPIAQCCHNVTDKGADEYKPLPIKRVGTGGFVKSAHESAEIDAFVVAHHVVEPTLGRLMIKDKAEFACGVEGASPAQHFSGVGAVIEVEALDYDESIGELEFAARRDVGLCHEESRS